MKERKPLKRTPIKQLSFDEQKQRKLKRQEKADRLGLRTKLNTQPSTNRGKMLKKRTLKPSVAKLKKKADATFSQYIRYRDGRRLSNGEWETQCFTCKEWKPFKQMQNGHFIRRSVNALRYAERNCAGQCYRCNVLRYGEQHLYALALDEKYGQGTAQSLQEQRFNTHKLTVEELEDIISKAKEYIKGVEDGTN